MNITSSNYISLLASLALVALLHSCANIVKPGGGPRDTEGPKIAEVVPEQGALNFDGKVIDFYFDEFLKPGSYSKEIFISPVLEKSPLVTVKNKRLRIEFREELRDSTTYVITLGKEIKDFNESNKMSNSFTYAFSTGNQLDSLKVKGKVSNAWTTKGQEGIKILLFPAEEIEGNNIYEQRPVYATETDKDGNFLLEYLKSGSYKIYGVGDKDQSYTYNSDLEMLALLENPVLDLTDSVTLAKNHELFAFFQDKEGPRVKSAKWSNDHTIHLKLSEPIRTTFGSDTLGITISDTFGDNRKAVFLARTKYRSPTDLYLYSPLPSSTPVNLYLFRMMDTLGTYTDTIVRINPNNIEKTEQGALFEQPIFQIEKDRIMLLSYFLLENSPNELNVELVDSAGEKIKLDIENFGFEASIQLSELPQPKMPYKLRILPEFQRGDGGTLDSLVEFEMQFPGLDEHGSVSGKVVADSSDLESKYVMLFMGKAPQQLTQAEPVSDGKKGGGSRKGNSTEILKRFNAPGPYQIYRILEGSYNIKYIKDDDGNGYFSPGSLEPYFMPERVYIDPTAFEVKAKWDVEGFNLFPGELKNVKVDKGGKGRTRTGQ